MNFLGSGMDKIDAAEVKAAAKARMRENGNYKRTALMIGLYMLLTLVPVMLMDYFSTGFIDMGKLDDSALLMLNSRLLLFQQLVAMLLTPAFELSKARFMIKTMRDGAGSPSDLFDGLGRGSYFVSVRSMLWHNLMMYIWMMIPISLIVQGMIGGGMLLYIIGSVLAMVIMVNRMLAYSQQFYLLAETPRMGAIMSLKLSTMFMNGRIWELLRLQLKLILYILPPILPSVAAFMLPDDPLIMLGMSACSILLSALCLPVAEAATAEYFLRLKAIIDSGTQRLRADIIEACSGGEGDECGKEDEYGAGKQSDGELPEGGSGKDEGDGGEVGH